MSTSLPHSGKIAVVTGASRGIGRAIALGLARAGAQVIAVARTQGALEALDDEILAETGRRATLVPLDLRKPEELDILGRALYDRFGRVDIVVHAAAVLGPISPAGHVEPKHWDEAIGVNLTATWRLIRSFEPLLKASAAGRAIFVTTGRVARPKAFWSPYAASKAGMEALVKCWADELEQTKVRAVLLDPGAMRTKMRAQAFPGEDPMTLPEPEAIVPLVIDLAGREQLPAMPETVVFKAG
jgi:NAD(P)-dependent dehydrogenase (short-subunit alcohol dehydrogenase family)